MKNKVVFFDLFDTLVHPNRGYLENYFTRDIDQMGDSGALRTADETILALASVANDRLDSSFSESRSYDEMARYYEQCMSDSIKSVDPCVLNMLSDLKSNGYNLCVISDAAFVDIADWKNSPLSAYFDDTVFSCEVGHVKPDVKLYEIAKQRMNNPSQSIFVGDGGHDELQGAKRAGMTTVKAEWLKCRHDKSIYDNSDFVVDSPDKLVDCVKAVGFERAASPGRVRRLPSMGEDLLATEYQMSHRSDVGFDYM